MPDVATTVKPWAVQDLAWLEAHQARSYERIAAALQENATGDRSAADVCQVGHDEVERIEALRGAVALRDLPDGALYRLLPGMRRSTAHVMEVVSTRGPDKTYVRWLGGADDIGSSMNISAAPSEHNGTLVDLVSLSGLDRQAALQLNDWLDSLPEDPGQRAFAGSGVRVARLDADTGEILRRRGDEHGPRLPRSGAIHLLLALRDA